MKGMPIDSFESHAFSKYASANETAVRQAIAGKCQTYIMNVHWSKSYSSDCNTK
jgi:hypothetical protein